MDSLLEDEVRSEIAGALTSSQYGGRDCVWHKTGTRMQLTRLTAGERLRICPSENNRECILQ
jgi:hypothetical protein